MACACESDAPFLLKFRVFLKDRPGSLSSFASTIARNGGNIGFFHYDRSIDANRVVTEVRMPTAAAMKDLLGRMDSKRYAFAPPRCRGDEVEVIAAENVMEIKVRLENRPGRLAAFARLLKLHQANVIYMFYDEDMDPESADIALATGDSAEIDSLLEAINEKGYHYRVVYRGTDKRRIDQIIGLKLVEKFYLRLKDLMPESGVDELKSMVESSREFSSDLVLFYSEAGNNLEAIDVFEKVLALASLSRSMVGDRFSVIEMPPLFFGPLRLLSFRLPTGENFYLFDFNGELTLIDTGYGVYYRDVKEMLRQRGLDPASVRRIYITHADADHAGAAGYFSEEFGTEVYMHPAGRGVIEHDDRSFGLASRYGRLNRYYTRLVNRFTGCRFPGHPKYFRVEPAGKAGAFPVIDRFEIGGLVFEVIQSLGGHIAGNVFFLNMEYGLLFTADYLLNVASLTTKHREALSVYKYLLISPNVNSRLFREEMGLLGDIITSLNEELRGQGRQMIVFPGHGDYYRYEQNGR